MSRGGVVPVGWWCVCRRGGWQAQQVNEWRCIGLGRLYDKSDAASGQPIDDGEVFGVEEASSMILAEILDRADTLYALFVFGSADQMNENEIARAVLVFHRDCPEARERAERLCLLVLPGSYTASLV